MARHEASPRIRPARLALSTIAAFLAVVAPSRADDEAVTVESLLKRMADTRWLASPVAEGERTVQFSSYDRATKLVDGKIVNPFANGDAGHYLRVEGEGDRKEYVLAESQGPGYVSRIWSANPDGNLRIYIDGNATPVLAGPFQAITEGKVAPFTAPFGHNASMGRNLYFPFPFARSIKISTTKGDQYFQVAVTTFAPGTRVESYSPEVLRRASPVMEEVREALLNPAMGRPADGGGWQYRGVVELPPGGEDELLAMPLAGSIRSMTAKVNGEDVDEALAKTLLTITFDGAEAPQVAVPLGEFFGSGPGLNPFQSAVHTVAKDGTLTARWYMPFHKSMQARLKSYATRPARVAITAFGDNDEPPAGTLTFHARWRQQDDIATKGGDGTMDWPSLRVSGAPGRFVGLLLDIYNPVKAWWGEGDEKIYVDGESFPSTIGTGTEDYFGYAWCNPELYMNPFHAQTRCDGPGNKGNSSEIRYQVLDAVPFHSSVAFDIELWHWAAVKVQYATLAFAYAGDGAKVEPGVPDLSARKLHAKPPIFREAGVLEGETLKVLSKTAGDISNQPMTGFSDGWSGDDQLWWRPAEAGARLELEIPVEKAGTYALSAAFTKACDYGIFELTLDGKPLREIDLYAAKPNVLHTGAVPLGTAALEPGNHVLAAKAAGKNAASVGYMLGLDWVKLTPAGN
ncbi:glycoside hydrolase family 172 protein [Aquisphaera insulae]|uniref:glycoside hydrolase family 172 protein n=1 Tax=Aquisphaera insulae TaxID=2712864 RepID=UPI0013EA5A45|nr:glycoside hydrolase family 172 protein [Aquisphaera insulae]